MQPLDTDIVKALTLDKCKGCVGFITKGVRAVKGILETCECGKLFEKFQRYNKAGIDREYWDFNFEDLDASFVKKNKQALEDCHFFVNNLETCILNTSQFLFVGSNGVGKSVVSYLLAKAALDQGYKCAVMTADELSNMLFDIERRDEVKQLDEADFLVIDEIDKFTGRNLEAINKVSNKISDFMRSKALILISNASIEDLSVLGFKGNFISRLEGMETLQWVGINFRSNSISKFRELKQAIEKGS